MTPGRTTHRCTAHLMRVARILLEPQLTVQGDALVDTAHRHCFIANNLSTEIAIEPSFRRVPG